jgi:hypothetical protein
LDLSVVGSLKTGCVGDGVFGVGLEVCEFLEMGKGLSALSVCTFSEIVKSNSDDRDEAIVKKIKLIKYI